MFGFLKAKKNDRNFYAPCSGQLIKITALDDPVFSSKMLGDGYVIDPDEGATTEVASPVFGTVTSVFPTKHAIGIQSDIGDEVLVHIGIDTVELEGKPFDIKVKTGDKVSPNKTMVIVDLEMLKELEKPASIITVFTNKPNVEQFSELTDQTVSQGDKLGTLA